jgi:hypothetical protein
MNQLTTTTQSPTQRQDQTKGVFSCLLMLLAFILPAIIFAFGAGKWDVQTGITLAGGVFLLFMVSSVLLAMTINNLSWLFSFLPLVGSMVYTVAPDFIPLPMDDIAALVVGAFFTLVLILKKVAPTYILLAVVITGFYAWFARGQIDGFLDEALLFLVVLVLGFIVSVRYRQQNG